MTKTFTAHRNDGSLLYSGRGKKGAAQKAIDALVEYRAAVKEASGNLYGHPWTLGHIKVDGVRVDADDSMYADDLAR